jgi:hypothetical protein
MRATRGRCGDYKGMLAMYEDFQQKKSFRTMAKMQADRQHRRLPRSVTPLWKLYGTTLVVALQVLELNSSFSCFLT